MTAAIDIPALADALACGHARAPKERRLALATYRALANGAPVTVEALAQRAALSPEDVRTMFEHWPGIERDRDGRVVGYGLTLEPTGHELALDAARLYTWCALGTRRAWSDGHEGTFVVSIEDGFELARRLAERISSAALVAGEG